MKIGFLSDLHITHNTSMLEYALHAILEATREAEIDKLFIVGDTTNNYETTLHFVDTLRLNGLETYVIFGNHEYWSLSYDEALKLTDPNYISGKVVELDEDNVVVAIDGFFDYSFVLEVDNLENQRLPKDKYALTSMGKKHFDLQRNKIKEYEKVFNSMIVRLEEMLKEYQDKNIILITHYVPHQEFVSYTSSDIWNSNNSFMGSIRFSELAEKYDVDKVIFGHTHTSFNDTINGVEYICNAVGYRDMEYQDVFKDRVKDQLTIVEI